MTLPRIRRICPDTSRAAARSGFLQLSDADKTAHGCPNPGRNPPSSLQRSFLFPQTRSASAADRIPHRGGSLRSEYRIAGDRIRCVLCSLLWCSREQDEKTSDPCLSGGSRRQCSDDTSRTPGRRHIRLSGRQALLGVERVVRPGPAVSKVTRSVSNAHSPQVLLEYITPRHPREAAGTSERAYFWIDSGAPGMIRFLPVYV